MTPDQIQPTLDRVLVRRISPEKVTQSGILIPGNTESQLAEVLAVGPGKDFPGGIEDPVPLKVGDKVVIGRGGIPIYVDGEELVCIRFLDIWAAVDD